MSWLKISQTTYSKPLHWGFGNEHCIAITEKTIAIFDRTFIGVHGVAKSLQRQTPT